MTTVSTVAAFLTEIESYGDAVYRGQAKAEWRVDCSAARRLAPGAKGEDLGKVTHSLAAYTEILLRGAVRHVGQDNDQRTTPDPHRLHPHSPGESHPGPDSRHTSGFEGIAR